MTNKALVSDSVGRSDMHALELDPRLKFRAPGFVPRVVRVNSFDEDAVAAFSNEISAAERTGQGIIPVIIDTYGGDTYGCMAMCDIIKACKVPVATIAQGKVMSSGAVLFICGTRGHRYMGPNSTMMVHDAATRVSWKKTEEVKVDAKETDRINKRTYAVIDKSCGQRVGYTWGLIQKRGRTDWYLTPKQAVQYGFADHVGVPTMRTRVEVITTLEFTR